MANESTQYMCCTCGKVYAANKFYKSYSALYKMGHLPICKDCFEHTYKIFVNTYISSKEAMKRMCMLFDIYFNGKLFDSCNINEETALGTYFRKLNIAQYKGKTFEYNFNNGNLLFENDKQQESDAEQITSTEEHSGVGSVPLTEEQSDVGSVSSAKIARWGIGLDPLDYDTLDAHYKYLKSSNPKFDSNQEIFILDLCYIHMQKMKALRTGEVDDFNKLTESYRKSFKQAGLKTADDISTDGDSWSMWVGMISQHVPEEIYKDKDRYKDYDGLGEYYERFIARPMRNIEFGSQERDEEFCVTEEDEQ